MTKPRQKTEVEAPAVAEQPATPNTFADATDYMRAIYGEFKAYVWEKAEYELPTNVRFTAGFTEHGKAISSRLAVNVIYPDFTVDGRFEIIARFSEGFQENIIDELYKILPRILRGSPDLDKSTRDIAWAIGLNAEKGVKNAFPKSKVRRELLDRLAQEYGEMPHRGIKFEALRKKRKEAMTGGKNVQSSRMLKVICRACDAKGGTKGNILRQSQGAILSYGIATCREHGDMIVELKPSDDKLAEGVPYYVKEAPAAEEAGAAPVAPPANDAQPPALAAAALLPAAE